MSDLYDMFGIEKATYNPPMGHYDKDLRSAVRILLQTKVWGDRMAVDSDDREAVALWAMANPDFAKTG